MKDFDYPLENILKLRIKNEDERLLDFSEAQRNYRRQKDFVDRIDGEIREIQNAFKRVEPNELSSRKGRYYYLENLRCKREKHENIAREAGKTCELNRRAFEEAKAKRKTLEIHKEKQFELHKLEQRRKEDRMLDEMAVTAFKRRLEL